MARTILRVPKPDQWSIDRIKEATVTPWSMHESTVPEVIHHKPAEQPQVTAKMAQVIRAYIKQPDLDTFGYTQGCKRCQHILTYGSGTMPHSDACRARIMAELAKTPSGRARLARMNERADKYIADHMKQQIEGSPAAAQGRDKDSGQQQPPPPPKFYLCQSSRSRSLNPVQQRLYQRQLSSAVLTPRQPTSMHPCPSQTTPSGTVKMLVMTWR